MAYRRFLVAAVLFLGLACASEARAQGFVHLMVGGGGDTRGDLSFDGRVGLFSTFQFQLGLEVDPLLGQPKDAGGGSYTLTQFSLGIQPYIDLGSVGLSARAAAGVGAVTAPSASSDGTTAGKLAATLILGGALHLWMASFVGLALEIDYRITYIASTFPNYPSRADDVVGRIYLEFAFPSH